MTLENDLKELLKKWEEQAELANINPSEFKHNQWWPGNRSGILSCFCDLRDILTKHNILTPPENNRNDPESQENLKNDPAHAENEKDA